MIYFTTNSNAISIGVRAAFVAIPAIAKTVSSLAVPIIVMGALANIPGAQATQYTDCIDKCNETAPYGLPRMICYTLCAIFAKN